MTRTSAILGQMGGAPVWYLIDNDIDVRHELDWPSFKAALAQAERRADLKRRWPRRLCIDGHAYHHRTRARRRNR